MAKNTTAMATLHIITEKILLCTPLLSLLTKCLIDSNKIVIINIFAIKQRVNRKKISVIIFCVPKLRFQLKKESSGIGIFSLYCIQLKNVVYERLTISSSVHFCVFKKNSMDFCILIFPIRSIEEANMYLKFFLAKANI